MCVVTCYNWWPFIRKHCNFYALWKIACANHIDVVVTLWSTIDVLSTLLVSVFLPIRSFDTKIIVLLHTYTLFFCFALAKGDAALTLLTSGQLAVGTLSFTTTQECDIQKNGHKNVLLSNAILMDTWTVWQAVSSAPSSSICFYFDRFGMAFGNKPTPT